MTQLFARIALVVLVGAFALSVSGKMADPVGFSYALEKLGAPSRWAWPLALGVLFVELLVGLGLLHPRTRRKSAAAAAVLLLIFAGVLIWLLVQGKSGADCACFGTMIRLRVGPWHVMENIALALLAGALARGAENRNEAPLARNDSGLSDLR
jgi:hypothetical protein